MSYFTLSAFFEYLCLWVYGYYKHCYSYSVEIVYRRQNLTSVDDVISQQPRQIYPVFDQCWATVYDVGPTLVKHRVDLSCLGRVRGLANHIVSPMELNDMRYSMFSIINFIEIMPHIEHIYMTLVLTLFSGDVCSP